MYAIRSYYARFEADTIRLDNIEARFEADTIRLDNIETRFEADTIRLDNIEARFEADTRITSYNVCYTKLLRVDLVRQAKKRGLPVTAETCPHYFTLTEEAVADGLHIVGLAVLVRARDIVTLLLAHLARHRGHGHAVHGHLGGDLPELVRPLGERSYNFV